MKKLTIEDVQLLNEIKSYKRASKEEVKKMQYFMTNFIDAKAHICPHCSGQIRFSHKRIINWSNINAGLINKVINPLDEEISKVNDEVNSLDKAIKEVSDYVSNACRVCGEEIKDRRKKTCNKCKENGKKKTNL